jgi:hypothetical protein
VAVFGVSSYAIQFMTYEKMKAWGFARKRAKLAKQGTVIPRDEDRLASISAILKDVGADYTSQEQYNVHCHERSKQDLRHDGNIPVPSGSITSSST